MFDNLLTNDLVRIAAAGGGFELSAGNRTVNDLVRIAAAAGGKSVIRLRGLGSRTVSDLVRIAAAGQGSVFFVD